MPYIDDDALDAALDNVRNNSETLHICSQEPANYTEAATTYTLGNKAAPTLGAVGDRTGGGRKFTVSAITDGDVTADGTASHWALVDDTNSKLKAANALASTQVVDDANPFTLTAFDVGLPDAVSE